MTFNDDGAAKVWWEDLTTRERSVWIQLTGSDDVVLAWLLSENSVVANEVREKVEQVLVEQSGEEVGFDEVGSKRAGLLTVHDVMARPLGKGRFITEAIRDIRRQDGTVFIRSGPGVSRVWAHPVNVRVPILKGGVVQAQNLGSIRAYRQREEF